MEQFQLYHFQEEHVKKIQMSLKNHKIALDISTLGAGKTFTALEITKDYESVLVISTPIILEKWKRLVTKYKLQSNKFDFITFSKIGRAEPRNFPSCKTLVIIDEVQYLKNYSKRNLNVSRHIQECKANVLAISGSPFDKPEHAVNLLRVLNIVPSDIPLVIYDIATFSYSYPASRTIRQNLKDKNLPDKELYFEGNKKAIERKLYFFFVRQILPKISHKMEGLPDKPAMNLFYNVINTRSNYPDRNVIEALLHKLNKLVVKVKNQGAKVELMSEITKIMKGLELYKIPAILNIVRKTLMKKTIVILLNYHDSINALVSFFPDAKVITGKTPRQKRNEILEEFNSGKVPILIGNLSVLSTGIDLDDKTGMYPRMAIINPNFNAITLYQSLARFNRIDTKSAVDIYLMYFGHNKILEEKKITDVLERKHKVIEELIKEELPKPKIVNFI